ncbi:MAG TPA: dihydroneopterin aldolase [Acidimicrobiales bacterium]|nr:dihydroneopterin aldolase [Acidimicrobiales bacterium]
MERPAQGPADGHHRRRAPRAPAHGSQRPRAADDGGGEVGLGAVPVPGPADAIELRGLRAVGVHGVLPEERSRPQPFVVDLDIELDASTAGASDDLADTVDYGAVADRVAAVVSGESFRLLEALATRIAESVLADPRAIAVTVSVRKSRPPVPVDLASAGVRLTRRRPS